MLKSLSLIVALVAVSVCGNAQGAILLVDEFDGAAGPLDNTKWVSGGFSVELDGAGHAVFDAANDQLSSVDTFLQENMTFTVSSQSAAHGFYGFRESSSNNILIRADTGKIEVRKGGATIAATTFNFKALSSAVVDIEWSASQLRILVDGSEKVNITNAADIPDVAMIAMFKIYGTSAGTLELDRVQVGVVPEPATLGLLGVGGLLMLTRGRK